MKNLLPLIVSVDYFINYFINLSSKRLPVAVDPSLLGTMASDTAGQLTIAVVLHPLQNSTLRAPLVQCKRLCVNVGATARNRTIQVRIHKAEHKATALPMQLLGQP